MRLPPDGQIMNAAALLAKTPNPTDEQITQAMNGNLCRCGTYERIRKAIHRAGVQVRPVQEVLDEPIKSARIRCGWSGRGSGAGGGLLLAACGEHRQKCVFRRTLTCESRRTRSRLYARARKMGQGVRTALPMILAEELEADWKQIEIEQAGASTLYGDQGTGGSASVKTTWDPMRKAGAAAREMLISAAALTWGVPRSSCAAENGAVVHGASKRRLSYGELVEKAATLPIPTDVPLKQNKDYKIVGHRLPRVDTPSKVRGDAVFGLDFRMPGMKYAVLSRSPTIGGKALSFDHKDSRKIAGVSYVGKISDAAVAVVADSVWGAMEGRRVLNVNWDEGPNKDLNTAAVMEALQQAASKKGASLYSPGDVSKMTGRRISAEYHLPFMAHAPMEPGNCTADFQGTSCELWAPTQVPQDCRDQVAKALGMDPDQVKVNVTLMGGGFGRRLEYDYAVEAALVSKAMNAPVKVIWTREDDMRFSTYRPMSLHQLSAVLDGAGWPVAFTHRIIAPSISGQKGQPGPNGVDPDLPDEAGSSTDCRMFRWSMCLQKPRCRWAGCGRCMRCRRRSRSESFIDELAVAAGKDPLEYRLHMLGKDQDIQYFDTTWRTARMRGVLQLAADKAGWKNLCRRAAFAGSPVSDAFLLTWPKWWRSAWRTTCRACIAWWRRWIAGRW